MQCFHLANAYLTYTRSRLEGQAVAVRLFLEALSIPQ